MPAPTNGNYSSTDDNSSGPMAGWNGNFNWDGTNITYTLSSSNTQLPAVSNHGNGDAFEFTISYNGQSARINVTPQGSDYKGHCKNPNSPAGDDGDAWTVKASSARPIAAGHH